MKTAVIISGGNLNLGFALDFLKKNTCEILIGADKGIRFLRQQGIMPTHIVGDFDSASDEDLEFFKRFTDIPIQIFNPVKDFTDTQIALELALKLGAKQIYILGGTGTRLDHVVANLKILELALKRGAVCFLVDVNNRIRLTANSVTIGREEQYGKYVSLFSFGGPVRGITLKGFYYLLTNYDMFPGDAVGVSNEITAENGEISFEKGLLLVIESKD